MKIKNNNNKKFKLSRISLQNLIKILNKKIPLFKRPINKVPSTVVQAKFTKEKYSENNLLFQECKIQLQEKQWCWWKWTIDMTLNRLWIFSLKNNKRRNKFIETITTCWKNQRLLQIFRLSGAKRAWSISRLGQLINKVSW